MDLLVFACYKVHCVFYNQNRVPFFVLGESSAVGAPHPAAPRCPEGTLWPGAGSSGTPCPVGLSAPSRLLLAPCWVASGFPRPRAACCLLHCGALYGRDDGFHYRLPQICRFTKRIYLVIF